VLRLLLLFALALALYEALRHAILKRARAALSKRARGYAEQHGVRVDLFKFGGKLLVREELLNDPHVLNAMSDAVKREESVGESAGGAGFAGDGRSAQARSIGGGAGFAGDGRSAQARSIGGARSIGSVRERVEVYIDEIVPAFSLTAYFEFGMKLARAAILAVYTPLVVGKPKALPENATAVFLINHRSNFDYLVVSWALARQVAISYAVGEWARVFPLDALFKAFGGFFVRRGFPDPLYHAVLRRYLQLITRRGVTQGIFPEGGLTRDGALRAPKVGLLDALLQLSAEPGFTRELYFVPVGINYDRVLEDHALLSETRGRDKPPAVAEKLRGALKLLAIVPFRILVNLLRVATGRLHRHGYVAVAFGEPLRLRDLPQAKRLGTATESERRGIAKEVAALLMERIARLVPATPVPLVAQAALELGETSKSALIVRVRELKARLDELQVPVALGSEFDPQRAAQEKLREDPDRNRDLARLESELLSSEEAEQIVRLGLKRLVQRGALRRDGNQISKGPHSELLAYYARSLACLPQPPAC
jgi:1-acyl-sn-glycerol-3-phosphate acyltransferase